MSRSAGSGARVTFDQRSSKSEVEQIRAAFGGLSIEPHSNGNFHLDMEFSHLPDVSFMSGSMSGVTLRRAGGPSEDGDGFTIWIVRDGAAFGESRSKDVTITPGEAVMARQDEDGYCAPTQPMRGTSLRLAGRLLRPLLRDVDTAVMRRLPGSNEALRHLVSYLDLTAARMPATPALQSLVTSHIYDLAALALGASRDAGEEVAKEGGLRAARLAAVKADIDAHLGDPDLRLGAVATRQRISPVYIRKLFESEGTNFTAYVLERRLARAFDMLSALSASLMPIGAIAFDVGFGDLSYFNRAFRKRFGATPSDIRQIALRRE